MPGSGARRATCQLSTSRLCAFGLSDRLALEEWSVTARKKLTVMHIVPCITPFQGWQDVPIPAGLRPALTCSALSGLV
ncbi:hypothetical protein [Mucilaginibacter gotjawali]|uniref:hypothetical protein n=1 Tax=Mucilaginibacter gotjawali TaxID=1550579 RepID=UPI001C848BFA|nr:hypothetical protein [Mucilaginibacter gotjawali]